MAEKKTHQELYDQVNQEIDDAQQFMEEFDEQLRREDAKWGPIEDAIEREMAQKVLSELGVDFRAVTGGDLHDDGVVVRTAAHFERFLNWYEESRKLWRNGYIGDDLQEQIASQFTPELMEKWRVNLMEDSATPEEVLALQEHMQRVCEDAHFVRQHIAGIEERRNEPQHSM